MSFEKNKCNIVNKTKLNEEQIIVDLLLNTDNLPNYQKICWINAYPEISTIETTNGQANYSGSVSYDIIYLDTDNKFQTYQASTPFMGKITNDLINPESKLRIKICVSDISYLENNQKIQTLLNLYPVVVNCSDIEIVTNGDENTIVKNEEIISQNLIFDGCTTFSEENTINFPENFEKILSVSTSVIIKDILPDNNLFVVQGELIHHIHYVILDGEMEKTKYLTVTEPFRREIESGGVNENSHIDAFALIKRSDYKFETNENNQILINVPIFLCYNIFEEIALPSAIDIFSLENNLDIVTNSFERTELTNIGAIDGKIEGSITLEDGEPRIDKVIGVSLCNCLPTNTFLSNGEIVLEGILNFALTYLNDENEVITTTKKQFPYVIKKQSEIENNIELYSNEVLSDIEIVARRGREIMIDGKLKAFIYGSTKQTEAAITDVTISSSLPLKEHSLEIYFAKTGEDIWDIAKELKVRPEIILQQNPEIVLPLENNQNIIIYNQKM